MNHLEGHTRFQLCSAKTESSGNLQASYTATHITPGAGGTHLSEEVMLYVQSESSSARIQFDECKADSPDAALDKLACRLERIALAIRNRKPSRLPGT